MMLQDGLFGIGDQGWKICACFGYLSPEGQLSVAVVFAPWFMSL